MPGQVCQKCGGGGWIVVERDGLSGAERCDCGEEDRTRRLVESAGIPPLYADASLDDFKNRDNAALKQVLVDVAAYIRLYPGGLPEPSKPGLLFIGGAGTGKTHLAVAALRALIGKGHEGIFCDYQNLLDRIRASYDPSSGASDREAYRSALDAEILLLDDLGAHRVTDWVEDTVTSIVTYRCNNQKTLIATTNLSDAQAGDRLPERGARALSRADWKISLAEKIGTRAWSRLFQMCRIVRMPPLEDYRVK